MSGAMACIWVERIEPTKATMSDWLASLEKASTAPGLVVWSSSMTISSFLPSTPPALLTASWAILAPMMAKAPEPAAGPVIGTTMPNFTVAPCAPALRTRAGIVTPAAKPAANVLRVTIIEHALPGTVPCLRATVANAVRLSSP